MDILEEKKSSNKTGEALVIGVCAFAIGMIFAMRYDYIKTKEKMVEYILQALNEAKNRNTAHIESILKVGNAAAETQRLGGTFYLDGEEIVFLKPVA